MTFLALALCFEAILLMRRGLRPLYAEISGSSMEPHLFGPRLLVDNNVSNFQSSYALDSLRPNSPVECQYTREQDASFQLLEALSSPNSVAPGETVQYYLRKRMAALRSASENDSPVLSYGESYQGLLRGDLVVIEPADADEREVKRIVGFPGEVVEIIDGDLWISGKRWKRNLQQIWEHSVLLDYGDGEANSYWNYGKWNSPGILLSKASEDGDNVDVSTVNNAVSNAKADKVLRVNDSLEFRLRSGGLITNELRWNAHDSHVLVPVSDVGFAIEIASEMSEWQIAVTLQSHELETVLVEKNGDNMTVSTSQHELTRQVADTFEPRWFAYLYVDGELILALVEEIRLLNREVAEHAARNIVLSESQWRLEAQRDSDRIHIRELIAEMVRRDVR